MSLSASSKKKKKKVEVKKTFSNYRHLHLSFLWHVFYKNIEIDDVTFEFLEMHYCIATKENLTGIIIQEKYLKSDKTLVSFGSSHQPECIWFFFKGIRLFSGRFTNNYRIQIFDIRTRSLWCSWLYFDPFKTLRLYIMKYSYKKPCRTKGPNDGISVYYFWSIL